jgi:endonuclease/exonuclease/phosphatase family metal-dependent hydrolase
MRIVSYNILDGGEGRADPLAEVILAQRPDVVVIVEADQLPVVERIATRLDMDFVHAPGRQHAAAIMSRWPIQDSINHSALRGHDFSFAEATIVASDGPWTIAAIHLSPHAREENEKTREKEIAIVLDRFSTHRRDRKRHILAGDFNANAPYQHIDIAKTKPRTQEDAKANGGVIPRRVVQTIIDAGYLDSLRAAHPDKLENSGSFTTQFPEQRVDYIFAFDVDNSRVKDAWIEHDRLAKYASDHYPVGAEFAD